MPIAQGEQGTESCTRTRGEVKQLGRQCWELRECDSEDLGLAPFCWRASFVEFAFGNIQGTHPCCSLFLQHPFGREVYMSTLQAAGHESPFHVFVVSYIYIYIYLYLLSLLSFFLSFMPTSRRVDWVDPKPKQTASLWFEAAVRWSPRSCAAALQQRQALG